MEMDFERFASALFAAAKDAGIAPAEIFYNKTESFSAHVRAQKLEDYKVSDSRSLTLRGKVNGRIGAGTTEALDEESIALLISAVKDSAAIIETDELNDIVGPDPHYETVCNYKPELEAVTAQQKIERAMEIDRLVAAKDACITPDSTVVASGEEEAVLRNTLGLDLSHRSNMIYAYANVAAREGERTSTGLKLLWGYSLDDIGAQEIADGVAEDALSKLHAGRIASGEYPVVIRNSAMAELLSTFSGIFSAENVQKGLSLLKGREGETIASDCVTLVDDPLLPYGLGTSPFDREGAATMTKNVIERGVLKTLLHNRKTAKKAGVSTTGNAVSGGRVAPSNFFIAPGEASMDALLAQMGDGILLTEVEGLHAGANPTSGDFSLLSRGFEVKGGKCVRAIEQFTVAGNFYELLKNVEAVGSDLLFEGAPVGCPSVRVKGISVAGE